MKNKIKVLSFVLSTLILLGATGCSSSEKFVLSGNDEYYDIENESTAGETTESSEETSSVKETYKVNTDTSKKTESKSKSAKKTADKTNSSDFEQLEDVGGGDYYFAMNIPSRKNAYKLSNVFEKMKAGKAVNVAYFGGSVTSGTGSSNSYTKSWRALTTAYLKSVSKGSVNETNAALGGAGSYLGAARFERDILKNNPDLLFIEFAINDYYSGISADQIKMNVEYMINKLYEQNPYADIVMVLVTNETYFGAAYPSYKAHREVADYYRIPIVDLGGEAYNKLKGKSSEFKKHFSDSVHPNDSGYKLYGDIMISALKELLTDKEKSPHTKPAKKLMSNGFSTLNNVLASSISATGWNLKSWFNNKDYEKDGSQFRYSDSLKKSYPKYLAPKETGNKITYTFTGNSFGILGTVKENVFLEIELDSSKKIKIDGVSKSELLEYPVFSGLSNSSHTVTVTVGGYSPYAAIAAFVTTKS